MATELSKMISEVTLGRESIIDIYRRDVKHPLGITRSTTWVDFQSTSKST